MELYDEIHVIGDTVEINYIENPGAAFGLTIKEIFGNVGFDITETTGKQILTLFSIGAVIVIVYLLKQVWKHRSPLPYFLSLILGGALGNIVDRVFYGIWFSGINNYEGKPLLGRVVDMFHIDFGSVNLLGTRVELWPVFNIADAAIFIGIVGILLFQRRFMKMHQKALDAEAALNTPPAEIVPKTEPEAPLPQPHQEEEK